MRPEVARPRPYLWNRLVPVLVLVAGLAATTLWAASSAAGTEDDRREVFARQVHSVETALTDGVARTEDTLEGLRGFVEASTEITAGEWEAYAQALQGTDFATFQGLSLVDVVPAEDLERYLASVRADQPGFALHPQVARAVHRPVRVSAPRDANRPAIGFDTAARPEMVAAQDAALRTGRPRLTAAFELVQRPGVPGAVLYLPVDGGASAVAPSQSLVAAPVVLPELTERVLAARDLSDVAVEVFAGDLETPPVVRWSVDDTAVAMEGRVATRSLDMAGQRWTVRVAGLGPLAPTGIGAWLPEAAAGTVLTGLLFALVLVLATAGSRAELRAAAATAGLQANEVQLKLSLARASAAEDRFRAIVEGAPDATLVVDGDGRIRLFSRQAETLFGYAAAEVIGQPVELLLPGRYRDAHLRHRTSYRSSPRPRAMGADLELFGLRKDGAEIPVEISLSPVHGSDGLSVVAAVRDSTQRRQAEAALRDAYEQARWAAETLQETDRLKDEFLGIAAHELRTPLTAIAGFSDLLLRRWEELESPLQRDFLVRIDRQASEMGAMIERLLDFTRLQAGRVEIHPTGLVMGAAFDDAVAGARTALGDRVVAVDVPAGLRALADPDAVRHVITNLLTNAAKFSPAGSTIWLRAEERDGWVVVSVTDSGTGIPYADQPKVFDRFFQGANQAAGKRGTGIGLSIVRRYVELHGGSVGVRSAPGGGSTFWFTLPVASSAAAAPAVGLSGASAEAAVTVESVPAEAEAAE